MKIANLFIAGAAALMMASCGGGMSFDEAKEIKKADRSKWTIEQKEAVIENTIRVWQEEMSEYDDVDFEQEYIDDLTISVSTAEAWAEKDPDLKDLVEELKKVGQEKDKAQEKAVADALEWAKENGITL